MQLQKFFLEVRGKKTLSSFGLVCNGDNTAWDHYQEKDFKEKFAIVNLKAIKKSLWFLVVIGLKIGVVTRLFLNFYFANMEIYHTCIRGDQISHLQSMVAKRGLTNWTNVHTPM